MIIAKDVAARERLQAKLEKVLANAFPQRGRARLAARARAAGRLAGAISRQRAGYRARCATSRCGSPASSPATRTRRHVNFDWMEPARQVRINIDQDQARLLGLSSQALASVLNTVVTGTTGHAGARRHLSGRCRRARDR